MIARRIARALGLLVLAVTGVLGIFNAVIERADGRTPLQMSVTAGVALYGILGLATAYGVLCRRRWSRWTVTAWGILITYVSTTAAIAYAGHAASAVAAAEAGLFAALIGIGVRWAVRNATVARVPRHDDMRGAD